MSEKALKVVPAPEAKARSDEQKSSEAAKPQRPGRKRLRMILLLVVPLIALLIGAGIYLMGGRYISTDNAYVGAQKVLITPDVSGKIVHIAVKEGQHVNPGDELFSLDPEPYWLALQEAQANSRRANRLYQGEILCSRR